MRWNVFQKDIGHRDVDLNPLHGLHAWPFFVHEGRRSPVGRVIKRIRRLASVKGRHVERMPEFDPF